MDSFKNLPQGAQCGLGWVSSRATGVLYPSGDLTEATVRDRGAGKMPALRKCRKGREVTGARPQMGLRYMHGAVPFSFLAVSVRLELDLWTRTSTKDWLEGWFQIPLHSADILLFFACKGEKAVSHKWTVERIDDLYRIRRDDGLEMTPATRDQLRRALQPHGIIGELYEDVCRQLNDTGEAEVSVATVRLRQLQGGNR